MIGYLMGFVASNVWCVWLPECQKVISTRDVVFDESKQYDPDDPFQGVNIPEREPDLPSQPALAPVPAIEANPSHNQ